MNLIYTKEEILTLCVLDYCKYISTTEIMNLDEYLY